MSEFDRKHGTHAHTDAPSVTVTAGETWCSTAVVPRLPQSRELEGRGVVQT